MRSPHRCTVPRPLLRLLGVGLAVLVAVLLAAPYLLEGPRLRSRLLHHLSQSVTGEISVQEVGWRWLPLPALTVRDLRVDTALFHLRLPFAECLLDPLFLLSGKASLVKARATAPSLALTRLDAGGSPFSAFPVVTSIQISDGRLSLPGWASSGDPESPLTLTGLDGVLSGQGKRLHFRGQAKESAFAHDLRLQLSADLGQGTYQGELSGQNLDSGRLLSPQGDQATLPVVRGMNFTSRFQGQGLASFRVQIRSDGTPFTVGVGTETLTARQVDDLTIQGDPHHLAITIGNLALDEPRLRLRGSITRQAPQDGTPAQWAIDLRGEDIDLGAVRARILALFGSHHLSQQVCAIVLGGEATSARYLFQGGVADFQHLDSLKLWVQAKDVPVLVPKIHLALDRASGPIAIVDGRLTGSGLSADIGDSQGRQGELLLDLDPDKHAFQLDLDLDVDLVNLQDVLAQVVPSPHFQDELSRFATINGRAQGHLRLGDDLRQLHTWVEVRQAQGQGHYDRLPWPFTLHAATLDIGPYQVAWHGVRGAIGSQGLLASQGEFNWEHGPRLQIKRLDADLDLEPLFQEGTLSRDRTRWAVADLFQGRVASLSGRAALREAKFTGLLRQADDWRYQATISCPELLFQAQGLPEIASQNSRLSLREQEAQFSGDVTLLGQDLRLTGRYRHQLLHGWHGELKIDGEVRENLGLWLDDHHLLPETMPLKVPFALRDLRVTTQEGGDLARISGDLAALAPDSDAAMEIDSTRLGETRTDTLVFRSADQVGTLRRQSGPGPRQSLAFQGQLGATTVNSLFTQQLMEQGQISGDFSLEWGDTDTVSAGWLAASHLRLGSQGPVPDLAIQALRLRADTANTLRIEHGDFLLADAPASLSGSIGIAKHGLQNLDLRLHLSRLPWATAKTLLDAYGKRRDSDSQAWLERLRGRIDFAIDELDYVRARTNGTASNLPPPAEHAIPLTDLHGTVTVRGPAAEVDLRQASACGLTVQGRWQFPGDDTADSEDTVRFASGDDTVFFEEALPCLGFQQSLILGPFSLEGRLSGHHNHWRQGELSLTSQGGLIKRLNLLSKIFTAVNFPDLLGWSTLPDIDEDGLPYGSLEVRAQVDDNHLRLERTMIKGKGVNVSGRGSIDLADMNTDLTFFIAPFKMVDSLVTSLPLIGKALGGSKESILTFPVAVSGNLRDPEVTALHPGALGNAALEFLRDTLTLPLRIIVPEEDAP